MAGRMARWWRVALGIACVWAGSGSASAQSPASTPPPVEAFFQRTKVPQAQLSPTGRYLAALTSLEKSEQIGFLIVDLQTMRQQFIAASTNDDIAWFRWVNDDWLLFNVDDPTDRSSVWELKGSGLMTLKRDGSDSRMIIKRRYTRWTEGSLRAVREFEPNHEFASLGAPGSAEIVLVEYLDYQDQEKRYRDSHVKVFDLSTASVRPAADKLPPRVTRWWFDAWGRPRVGARHEGALVTYLWADKTGAWREIAQMPWNAQPFTPAYVEGDDQLVVKTFDGAGTLQLRRFDFGAGKVAGGDPIVATPGFDGAVSVRRVRGTGAVQGVDLLVDSQVTAWFSPTAAKLQADVDAKLPDRVNLLQCGGACDAATPVVLVHSYADQDPGRFLLYRPAQGSLQQIAPQRPEIDPARMAKLSFQRFKARDGHEVPVWITRPPGAAAGQRLPTVVLVHGGPWLRGTQWRWDPEAQFLASRGYIVIEPEYRGSSGYGVQHERAGFKQWGAAIQDDISDALKFAVANAGADPARACIMGASFGGYATLMGLVKDPDQYRCGIAFVAVSDPRHMYEFTWNDIGEFGKSISLPLMLGDPVKDEALLIAGSPLVHADRIQAPLLLVHGGRDRRVPVQNGERMRDALVKLGKPVEWVLYEDEYHGFVHKTNEYDYWRRVEAFLAKHLKKP